MGRWERVLKIAILFFSLIGCARVAPYRVTNYFVDADISRLFNQSVAVLPFENWSDSSEAGMKVTDEFNLQLGRVGLFNLVERRRIQELYKEQDLDPQRVDQETAVKIGKMLGAHGVILGSVSKYRSGEVGASARLVDVETGKQLWQARDTILGKSPAVQQLVDSGYDRKRLKTDADFLAQILCRELALTLKRK